MCKYLKIITDLSNLVYTTLGPGYAESVYQKALAVEFRNNAMQYEMESVIPITYKGICIGSGRADFIVFTDSNEKIVIELKAVSTIPGDAEFAQLNTYLSATSITHGIVINFPQSFKNERKVVDVKTNMVEKE